MLFNSLDFLIFFPAVCLLFWLVPAKFRQVFLLICSYFFYMCWNPWCIFLILFSTIVTYCCGLFMDRSGSDKNRKLIMALGITANLLILFFFKYLGFALDTLGVIIRHEFGPLDIILPVGISFYTFQALGYVIDCYRGDIEPEKNFIQYALFVSFFPQLVAGPIERSGNLLHQIRRLSVVTRRDLIDVEHIQQGFILMAWGMFLKLIIADRIAIVVDNVYLNIYEYGTVGLLMALVGFGIQIYCDFGSYSIIAIGAARILGIDLMENFNAPYFSTSITDFWRRWHISLSSWFRDYLYIPLGGSRKGFKRKLLNLVIIFLCSGLWHGANWTFVFWGLLHGLMLVTENLIRPVIHKIDDYFGINKKTIGFMLCRAFVVSALVDVAWVFFRAESFRQAFAFFKRLIIKQDFWTLFDGTIYTYGLDVTEMHILIAGLILLVVVDLIRVRKGLAIDKWIMSQYAVFRVLFVLAIVMFTVMFGVYGPGFDSKDFIYFQF